ncbi:hypothetical protein Ancab_029612, partial [Ancistrocladus abbreviatus]
MNTISSDRPPPFSASNLIIPRSEASTFQFEAKHTVEGVKILHSTQSKGEKVGILLTCFDSRDSM